MIKLIALDIDGTLLQNDEREIEPIVLREVARLMDKGVLFTTASGRQYSSLRHLFAPVADRMYYLCENSAVIFGQGNPGPVLGKTVIAREEALSLCHDILALEDCEALISGANTSYVCPKQPDYVDLVRYAVGNNTTVVPNPEAIPEDIVKVSVYCRRTAAEVVPMLFPRWEKCLGGAISGKQWIDFSLADKGTGLQKLGKLLGIRPQEMMAFGDNHNDISMLRLVGYPYLMEGADREMRAQFLQQCRRVQDVLQTL